MSSTPALGALSLLAPFSLAVMLVTLGALSRRLGRVTHARRFYLAFHTAALLALVAGLVRAYDLSLAVSVDLGHNYPWATLYHALMAASVTVGLAVGWRYWSWLLAERD
jgi:hypothetical protein